MLRDWLRKARVDIALLAEINLFWPAIPEGRKWRDRVRDVMKSAHYSSSAHNIHSGPCSNCSFKQYGGCTATAFNRSANGAVASGKDPSGLGRWAWVRIKGKQLPVGEDGEDANTPVANSRDLVLVSAYRPNPPGVGTNTVWIQQRTYFLSKDRDVDPREAFMSDLLDEIILWRTKGYEVIVGVDANENLVSRSDNSFRHRFWAAGMTEAILSRHGDNAPKTFQRRTSQVPIDGIFVSPGVKVLNGGYLGFGENILSDHRCLWIDFDLKSTLGGFTPTKSTFVPRRLTMRDGMAVRRYLRKAESEYTRLNIHTRLGDLSRLYSAQGNKLTPRQQRSFNFIHRQMYDARRKAESSCRKLRMGGVPFSPKTQYLRDRIYMWKLLIKAAKDLPVSSRRIRRLMKKLEEPNAWRLSLLELEENLKKDLADYTEVKKSVQAQENRSQFIAKRRQWARARKHRSLYALSRSERLDRMRQRETTRRRKAAQGKCFSGGLKAIQVEQTQRDGSMKLLTLTKPDVVAEGCRQENRARYDQTRFPFVTPPMDEPLYEMFTGENAHENTMALVEGRLPSLPVDCSTQAFLNQCRLPPKHSFQDLTVSVEDHIDFWSKAKEDKGSEPHGLHNGHFKAGAKSDLLSQCDTIMRDIPMNTGICPDLWKNLMNFSIEKQPGNFRLSKMRTIQMMNSEFQANNKKAGKAAMVFAEENKIIPPGQCGSRKNHEAIALVIAKRCCWDLLAIQRRAAGWISNDAKSCFDRIVHWVGMVALLRLGIPWSVVMMMFGTLQLAKHRVRTGYGDTEEVFEPPSDIPFQGCGQGNGAGPTIWVAVSAILIGVMQAAGFGFECVTAVSGCLLLADCFCFVDDSDVVEAASSLSQRGEDIFQSVQRAMDLWAGGVRATGGALNPPKCFWWLIDFKWNPSSGKWTFRRKKDFDWSGPRQRWQLSRPSEWIGALLTRDLDGSTVPIRQLEPDEAEKTLGVMMAPNDNGSAQKKFLLSKTTEWAEKVRSGRLQKHDVIPMVSTTIMKTVEYSMALTSFSQEEWMAIMSPVLMVCLPKAGVCRKFKQIMAFSPLRFQGLGIPHPYVSQIFHHLNMLMKNLSVPSQVTPYIKAVLEGHRLETGTDYELFQQVYQNTAILTTNTWAKRLWEGFDRHEIHLEIEPDDDLVLLREGDARLLQLFVDALAPQEELRWLKLCRDYLNVATVADIVTADGKFIIEEAWEGKWFSHRRTKYGWPRSCRPSSSYWDLWRFWIQKTLTINDRKGRTLRNPLGDWHDDIRDWNWLFSPSESSLFRRTGHIWSRGVLSSHSQRSQHRAFKFSSSSPWWSASLPTDVQRVTVSCGKVVQGSFSATITGVGQERVQDDNHGPPSLIAAWQRDASRINGSYGWVPDAIRIEGSEEDLALALFAGELRIISDGSYDDEVGTTVIQLCTEDRSSIIWVTTQCPGLQWVQSAYRAELVGPLAGVMTATWLKSEWDPSCEFEPSVLFACDGRAALCKVFLPNRPRPTQRQFDVIISARRAIEQSGISWIPYHVKGHADECRPWSDLTWMERRNVEVDQLAVQHRHLLMTSGQTVARNPRFFHEPCALFIKGSKCSWLARHLLEDQILLPQLQEYWAERRQMDCRAIGLIDWFTVQGAMKSLPAGIQRWCTKNVVGMCATGRFRLRWKLDVTDQCPLCEHVEDFRHVPRCESLSATNEWDKRVDLLVSWLEQNLTAPAISTSLLGLLSQVRDPQAMLTTRSSSPGYSSADMVQARVNQAIIGPQGLLEGLLAADWIPIQQAHYQSLGSRRSAKRWAISTSKQLIMIGFHMWTNRNEALHSGDCLLGERKAREVEVELREQYAQGDAGLPSPAARQFKIPLERLLSQSLPQKQRWVKWMRFEREAVERKLQTRRRLMFNLTHPKAKAGSNTVKSRSRRVTKNKSNATQKRKRKQKSTSSYLQRSLLGWSTRGRR